MLQEPDLEAFSSLGAGTHRSQGAGRRGAIPFYTENMVCRSFYVRDLSVSHSPSLCNDSLCSQQSQVLSPVAETRAQNLELQLLGQPPPPCSSGLLLSQATCACENGGRQGYSKACGLMRPSTPIQTKSKNDRNQQGCANTQHPGCRKKLGGRRRRRIMRSPHKRSKAGPARTRRTTG